MAGARITVEPACLSEQVWETVTDLACLDWRSDVEQVKVTKEGEPLWSTRPAVLPLCLPLPSGNAPSRGL